MTTETQSELESVLGDILMKYGGYVGVPLPAWSRQFVFCSSRKWAFDLAFPDLRVAVEVDGGQHKAGGGRHNLTTDREKLNAAAALGWRVVRLDGTMLGCETYVLHLLASLLLPGEAAVPWRIKLVAEDRFLAAARGVRRRRVARKASREAWVAERYRVGGSVPHGGSVG